MAASFMYIRFPDGIELGPIPTHRVREAVLAGHLPSGTVVRPDSSAIWISESSWAGGVFEEAPVVPNRRAASPAVGGREVRVRLLNGGEIGPVPESMIRTMVECRLLEPKDLIQRVGGERWREAGTAAARFFAEQEQAAQPKDPVAGASIGSTFAGASVPSSQPTIVKVVTPPPKPMSRSERVVRGVLLVGVPILILIGALTRPIERWMDASSERDEAIETLAEAVESYGVLVEQESLVDSASFNLSTAVANAQSEADQLTAALDRILRKFNEADQLVTWAEAISQEIQDRAASQAQTRQWLTDALLSLDRRAQDFNSAQGSDRLSGRGTRRPQSQRTADALQDVREVEAKVIHLQQSLAEESDGLRKALELLPRIHDALRELPLLEAASEATERAAVKARAELERLRRAQEAVQRRERAQAVLTAKNAACVDAGTGVRRAALWAVLAAVGADLLLMGMHAFVRSRRSDAPKPLRRAIDLP